MELITVEDIGDMYNYDEEEDELDDGIIVDDDCVINDDCIIVDDDCVIIDDDNDDHYNPF